VNPNLGWTLLGLFCGSLLLWRLAPGEQRRIRFVWALAALALTLWLIATFLSPPSWIAEAVTALEQVIALHLAVVVLFDLLLKRLRTPRILIELTIGAGYAAILLVLLTRVGVNLTGLIATSAVLTAVIGFGLQDLLGNLAGGLAMQVEQTIQEGDWLRTDQYLGQVRSIRVRHTVLETPDGDTILAPNSAITRSPVTLLGRTSAGGPIKHRKLVTFQLPYSGPTPSAVVDAVNQALAASPMDGIATDPAPRCVIVDFHPYHIQYGALVWMMRPGMEYLDISAVRMRITFALERSGFPLTSISHAVDLHTNVAPAGSDAEDRLAALRRVEIFQSLSEEEAHQLASRIKKESFAPGEIILRQGDDGDSLYILRRGRVRILLSGPSGLSEQVASLSAGDFFGEMSLLTGEKRAATALAIDQADCYSVAKADLNALMNERPALAGDISSVLVNRQMGLAAVRDKLDEESERRRELQSQGHLLGRIKSYFGIR
jgi:small-conductance mechanosensitive channel/CRP-like cAMP-binding protein